MSARDTKAAGMLVGLLAIVSLARGATTSRPVVREAPQKHVLGHGARELREGATLELNQASVADLCLLPRIGHALAERVVRYRELHGPYRSLADLDAVPGVGPRTVETLRPLLRIDAASVNPK